MMIAFDASCRDRIAGYLGIAQKAGKIAAGDNRAAEALNANKCFLLVLAEDAAETVRKELLELAQKKQIPVLAWANKTDLGLIVGKSRRGALVVLDAGFAEAIMKVINGGA